MLKSQFISQQIIIFDKLLEKLLLKCTVDSNGEREYIDLCIDAFSNALTIVLDVGLEPSLRQIEAQLPHSLDRATFELWWQVNHLDWSKGLRTVISVYRQLSR